MKDGSGRRRWPWVLLALFAAVTGAGWVALSRLDAFLLARAQAELDVYAAKLGRRATIGALKTKLLGGVGVRIDNVEVGPGPGEDRAAASLTRAEVEVALWPVVASRGKEVPVRAVGVEGLHLNVLRRKDGTTNFEEIADKLAPGQAPQTGPDLDAGPSRDLSAIRIDRISVAGDISLVELGAEPRELAIRDIELRVNDLRAGKSLEVVLGAAVLAPARNLSVKLTTAPLPPSLVPTPERLALALKPLDLAPLVPFLPASVGLRGGALDADFQAQLGTAVPEGKGPTRVVGTLHGKGLRFAEAEGGKALDATLEADVAGDTQRGDLELKQLHLALGPAELDGKGAVRGLLGDSPEVKGLAIVGKNLDPALIAPYYPPLRTMLHGISGPLGLDVHASGTEAKQSIALLLDFTEMQLALPKKLSKAAGAPMKLEATLSGAAKGAMHFEARLDASGADLRPSGQLDKPPGQPASLAVAGTYRPLRGKGGGLALELSSLSVNVRNDGLSGTGKLESSGTGAARKTQLRAALKSARLDADALLLAEEDAPTVRSASTSGTAKSKKTEPSTAYDGLDAEVAFDVAALRYKQTDFQNVSGLARLEGDRLEMKRFKAGVAGGTVVLDGTSARLAPADRPFELKAKANGLAMAALLPRSVPSDLVTGRFSGEVALAGAGTDRASLSKNLTGIIQGLVLDGSFKGIDVFGELAGPLAKALPFGGQTLKEQVTSFGDKLPFGLEFANGVARLKKPLEFSQPRGSLKVDGGIDLSGKLDLGGTVALAPVLVQQLTRGKVTLKEPLPIGFKLTGPVAAPQVTALDLKPALTLLAREGATQGLSELAKTKLGGKLAEKLEQAGLGGAAAPTSPPEAQAQVEEAARREAEEAKKRLQNKAKEKLKGLFGR